MIQIITVAVPVWVQVEVSGMTMTTKIMMIQEIGEVRAETKAEVMAMDKMIMVVQAVPIPEGDLVA